jgi:hypothetical protein
VNQPTQVPHTSDVPVLTGPSGALAPLPYSSGISVDTLAAGVTQARDNLLGAARAHGEAEVSIRDQNAFAGQAVADQLVRNLAANPTAAAAFQAELQPATNVLPMFPGGSAPVSTAPGTMSEQQMIAAILTPEALAAVGAGPAPGAPGAAPVLATSASPHQPPAAPAAPTLSPDIQAIVESNRAISEQLRAQVDFNARQQQAALQYQQQQAAAQAQAARFAWKSPDAEAAALTEARIDFNDPKALAAARFAYRQYHESQDALAERDAKIAQLEANQQALMQHFQGLQQGAQQITAQQAVTHHVSRALPATVPANVRSQVEANTMALLRAGVPGEQALQMATAPILAMLPPAAPARPQMPAPLTPSAAQLHAMALGGGGTGASPLPTAPQASTFQMPSLNQLDVLFAQRMVRGG